MEFPVSFTPFNNYHSIVGACFASPMNLDIILIVGIRTGVAGIRETILLEDLIPALQVNQFLHLPVEFYLVATQPKHTTFQVQL